MENFNNLEVLYQKVHLFRELCEVKLSPKDKKPLIR